MKLHQPTLCLDSRQLTASLSRNKIFTGVGPQPITTQKILNKEIAPKPDSEEAKLSSSKAKQSVLNLTYLGKNAVTRYLTDVESTTLDSTVAGFTY